MAVRLTPLLLLIASFQVSCVLGQETNFPGMIKSESDETKHRIVRAEFSKRDLASQSTSLNMANSDDSERTIAFQPQLSVVHNSAIKIDPKMIQHQNCKTRIGPGPMGSRYFHVGFNEATVGYWFEAFNGIMPMNGKDNIPWKDDLVSYKFGLEGYRYNPSTQLYELRLPIPNHPGYYGEMAVNVDPFLININSIKLEIRKGNPDQDFSEMPIESTFLCRSKIN